MQPFSEDPTIFQKKKIGPQLFFLSTCPAAQTSPELIFHIIDMSQVSLSVSVDWIKPNYSLFPYFEGTQSVVAASLSGGVSVASSAPTMQVSGPALKMNTTNHQPINQSYNNPVNVQSRHRWFSVGICISISQIIDHMTCDKSSDWLKLLKSNGEHIFQRIF